MTLSRQSARHALVAWAKWSVTNAEKFQWAEVRPFTLSRQGPFVLDCSAFSIWACWRSGVLRDPSGFSWQGIGNSTSFFQRGRHVPLSRVQPGDFITYGVNGDEHMAIVVERGNDPLTVSHGGPTGESPALVRVSQDGRQPQTYLRFDLGARHATPPPAPTMAQIAEAGFVVLTDPSQWNLALANGWAVHAWSGTAFVAMPAPFIPNTNYYADFHFATKRRV